MRRVWGVGWGAAIVVGCAVVLGAAVGMGQGGAPTTQAAPLARYVPAEGLVAYVEFDGIDAHTEAWRRTAAHAVLAETTTGAMLKAVIQQVADGILNQMDEKPLDGGQLAALVEHVARHGFAFGINAPEMGEGPPLVTLVIRGGAQAAVKAPLEALVRSAVPEDAATQVVTRQDGRRLVVVRGAEGQPGWAFWSEGDDLVVSIGREDLGAERVIAAVEGKAKNLVEDPTRIALAKTEDDFEPAARGWFDASVLPPTPPALGLGGLKRIDFRWGFRGKELVSVTRVLAPSPRTGLLALMDQPAIDADHVPPLPEGLHGYVLLSRDPAKMYDAVAPAVAALAPGGQDALDGFNQQFTQRTGLKLRDEVLAAVGPRVAFYLQPRTIPAPLTPFNALGAWMLKMPPVVGVTEVNDPDKMQRALDALAKLANEALAKATGANGDPLRLEPLGGTDRGYRLVVPPALFPLPTSVAPGIVVGPKYAAFSTHVDAARAAVAPPGERTVPGADVLRPGTVFLEVHDPSEAMPELIANIPFFVQLLGKIGPGGPFGPPSADNPFGSVVIDPKLIPAPDAIRAHLFPGSTAAVVSDEGLTITTRDSIPSINSAGALPVAAGFLLPAVYSAREAARRSQSVYNLKMIALAMHNYHAQNNHFPAAAICDADGKPLLSWRVAILPFIEQQALYDQFHLDEPWDSEHNKALAESIPAIYVAPTSRSVPRGQTFYQVFTGNGAAFEETEPAGIQDFTDGTSNTILVVEGGTPVPWTKPEDISFDPEKDVPRLGGPGYKGGFDAAFADGSVKFLKFTIDMDVLKALITRAGGEVIAAEDIFQ
jgi:hypothetical protein